MSHFDLWSLPIELLMHTLRSLDYQDLAHLNCTCRQMNKIVEPLIWSNIEFHNTGYHESSSELNEPPPHIPVSKRAYQVTSKSERPLWPIVMRSGAQKAERFVKLLQSYHATDQDRLKVLCSRVKSLCTIVELWWGRNNEHEPQGIAFWYLLPYFQNLEELELHGGHPYSASDWVDVENISAPPLPHLRFAKLFAYIPCQVAQWILGSGPTLERLELGLLDRPISSNTAYHPAFPPLPKDKINASDEDTDAESDYGSVNGETVIPRPLGGFLPTNTKLELPKLRTLYLCSTADSPYEGSIRTYSWSSRAEKASLADWKGILLASSSTLDTLVLEHRPGEESIESGGLSSQEIILQNKDGSINRRLVRMFRQLLANETSFPSLRRVYLYGIAVAENRKDKPTKKACGGQVMLSLKDRGIKCEARIGTTCFFREEEGFAYWCNWDGAYDDDEEGSDYIIDQDSEFDYRSDRWDDILASV